MRGVCSVRCAGRLVVVAPRLATGREGEASLLGLGPMMKPLRHPATLLLALLWLRETMGPIRVPASVRARAARGVSMGQELFCKGRERRRRRKKGEEKEKEGGRQGQGK